MGIHWHSTWPHCFFPSPWQPLQLQRGAGKPAPRTPEVHVGVQEDLEAYLQNLDFFFWEKLFLRRFSGSA